MGLGEAIWADFWWKMHSATSPIDLDRFRPDPTDPEIQKITDLFPLSVLPKSSPDAVCKRDLHHTHTHPLTGGFSLETENCHETALGEAFWADFWWKINSATSPIDLDRFRSDLDDPKIQKNPGRSRVSFLI